MTAVSCSAYEAPAVRYADFIAAETESVSSQDDRSFWERITDANVPFTLPAGWGAQGEAGDALRLELDFRDLEEDLRRLSKQADTSFKSVLLAAHAKVMSALTTEDAFHLGVVFHGRLEAPGADRVLGMHLNTLPFPVARPTGTWQQLVKRVYAQETEIWAHRRYPLPAIQRSARTEHRLISVMFDHLDFHQVDSDTVDVGAGLGTGANEFAVNVIATGGKLVVKAGTDALGPAAAQRLVAMYRLVLEAMANDPDGDATAAYLPEVEKPHVSRLRTEATNQVLTLEMFESQAASTPRSVAVVCADERLSYEELEKRSNQLARHLLGLGVGAGSVVGVCLERSPAVLVAMLASWKVGAAYVPVDPALPAERRDYMLVDAGVSVLVTESGVAEFDGRCVLLDAEHEVIGQESVEPLGVRPGGDELAYVLYTSGSTGKPKGVMIPPTRRCTTCWYPSGTTSASAGVARGWRRRRSRSTSRVWSCSCR
ncbi:hypothetical protein GCM10020000_13190 [Streptomyces olivoverticillatus]